MKETNDMFIENEFVQLYIKGELSAVELINNLEADVLHLVMEKAKYNQSKAAIELGLSRGCLRSKLFKHFGNKYFPGI